eukprot:TRINITY_DN19514_c0_g1_i1.p1 TRINITY_DN19514_c0_g1~~TRINITY_DN19514_c0_g1_i1.p1  ORF type:complete len:455 (+),score=118.79 TRINITY_DN19514_c0_g1_i1:173-1537(+)
MNVSEIMSDLDDLDALLTSLENRKDSTDFVADISTPSTTYGMSPAESQTSSEQEDPAWLHDQHLEEAAQSRQISGYPLGESLQRQITICSEAADGLQRKISNLSSWMRQGSALSVCSIASNVSQLRYADPSETLIFLDWDDTLFPTAELFDKWKLPCRPGSWSHMLLEPQEEQKLERWREALKEHVEMALALSSHVCVVTNAKRPWVSRCIDAFCPNLAYLFEDDEEKRVGTPTSAPVTSGRCCIVYANEKLPPRQQMAMPVRHTFHKASPEEDDERLTSAKKHAMKLQAKAFYSQRRGQTWKNILSFGDADYERDALLDVVFQRNSPSRERLRAKVMKTPMRPNLEDLTYRLKLGACLMPMQVQYDGDIDLNLNTSDLGGVLAESLQAPELEEMVMPMPSRRGKAKCDLPGQCNSEYAWDRQASDPPELEEEAVALEMLDNYVRRATKESVLR